MLDLPDHILDMMPTYNPDRIRTLRHSGASVHFRGFKVSLPPEGWRDETVAERQYVVEWPTYSNFWIPASLTFTGSSEDLITYLTALLAKDTLVQDVHEKKGKVRDIVLRKAPQDAAIVKISPERLLAVMLGVDPLEVPINATLQFSQGRIMKTAKLIQATLVAKGYLPAMTQEQIKNVLKRFSKYAPATTGIGLDPAKKQAMHHYLDGDEAQAPAAVEEVLVLSDEHDLYREAISMVMAERKYFVRRVTKLDGTPLLTGTAWSLNGPWNIASINQIGCAAAGVEDVA